MPGSTEAQRVDHRQLWLKGQMPNWCFRYLQTIMKLGNIRGNQLQLWVSPF